MPDATSPVPQAITIETTCTPASTLPQSMHPQYRSPVPPAITIEATCTPAEVRTDPGKKQDILHAVNTAQVRNFLTDIEIDATGLLTPDVISTSNFIQSINSAAWEYTI